MTLLHEPQFQIGDKVTAIALPNAFPKACAEVRGLTVVSIQLHQGRVLDTDFLPYYRVLAHGEGGLTSVEGAERFFEHARVRA